MQRTGDGAEVISPYAGVLRWVIAIAALLGDVATTLIDLPNPTWTAAAYATFTSIAAFVAKSPWDSPTATHVAIDELPAEIRDAVRATRSAALRRPRDAV